jgi:hypothetical protein
MEIERTADELGLTEEQKKLLREKLEGKEVDSISGTVSAEAAAKSVAEDVAQDKSEVVQPKAKTKGKEKGKVL